jgi:hypothetical protein
MFGVFLPLFRPDRAKPMEWKVEPAAQDIDLRDWFAGQALAGIMADPNWSGTTQTTAKSAYQIADAMLAERDREAAP